MSAISCAYCGKPTPLLEVPDRTYARCPECHYIGRRVYVDPGTSSEDLPTRCGHIERVERQGGSLALMVRHDHGQLLAWLPRELSDAKPLRSAWSRLSGWCMRLLWTLVRWLS